MAGFRFDHSYLSFPWRKDGPKGSRNRAKTRAGPYLLTPPKSGYRSRISCARMFPSRMGRSRVRRRRRDGEGCGEGEA